MAWLSSLSDIALVYDLPESDIEQRMYTLAELVHQHYCLQRGIINHNESRPDQHVALSLLGALAATDWFFVKRAERIWPAPDPIPVEPILHFGDGSINEGWVGDPEKG